MVIKVLCVSIQMCKKMCKEMQSVVHLIRQIQSATTKGLQDNNAKIVVSGREGLHDLEIPDVKEVWQPQNSRCCYYS